jgi:hypothetical protein
MKRERKRRIRWQSRGLVVALAVTVGLLPGLAAAEETFFARITLWEVQEYLRLKASSHRDNIAFRLANATLVGDASDGLCAGTGAAECAMDARARSTVSLKTGSGPISGAFNILLDTNPGSPLLSDLSLVASGTLEGTLDLNPVLLFLATEGAVGAPVAPAQGRWRSRELDARGSFSGAFLIPIPSAKLMAMFGRPDCERKFAYFNPLTAPLVLDCLGDADFSLGIPVTKFVGTLTAR